MTEDKNLNDILLAMSEYHTGSERDAKEAIAAIYDAGMMIVDQTRAQPKYKRVDLDEMLKQQRRSPWFEQGYSQAIDDIKSKYGDIYVLTKEGDEK